MLNRTLPAIDLLRWLFNTDFVEIQAEIGKGLLHPDTDDISVLSLALTNGAYATLEVSWSLPASYPLRENLRMEMLGDAGSIKVDAFHQSIDGYAAGVTRIYWGSHPLDELVRHFMDCISSKCIPLISANDALRAHEIAQLASRVALSFQCVRV